MCTVLYLSGRETTCNSVVQVLEGAGAVMGAAGATAAVVAAAAEVLPPLLHHRVPYTVQTCLVCDTGLRAGGGRMQADEAQFQPAQTQTHMTPIIKQITQLSLEAGKKTDMPNVCTLLLPT